MCSATLILALLLAIEFVARLVLEIRERRLTQMRGGIFTLLLTLTESRYSTGFSVMYFLRIRNA